MSNYLGNTKLSRGIRNNNPGNLRITDDNWVGMIPREQNTDGSFVQFKEMKYGIRAMLRDVVNDILKGKNTVRKLITEYAPPTENNTEIYINGVAKKMGLKPDDVIKNIDANFLRQISKAIVSHEIKASEQKLVTDTDINKAIAILGKFNAPKGFKISTNIIGLSLLFPLFLLFYTWLSVIL